jgi:hypothetical protein
MTKEGKKKANKKYYEANRERLLDCSKEYYRRNKSCMLAKNKKWMEDNKDTWQAYLRCYYQTNKQKAKAASAEWVKNNLASVNEYRRKWRESNPEYTKEYHRRRRAADPIYGLMHNIRSRQGAVLKGKYSTTKGLGCDKNFLKEYLEKQFTEGMRWDNYGKKKGQWSIDHIKPLDLLHTNPELLPELVHYTNLQPMWHVDNIRKKNKIILKVVGSLKQ